MPHATHQDRTPRAAPAGRAVVALLLKERDECAADVGSAVNTLSCTLARYAEINRQLALAALPVAAPMDGAMR